MINLNEETIYLLREEMNKIFKGDNDITFYLKMMDLLDIHNKSISIEHRNKLIQEYNLKEIQDKYKNKINVK